MTTFNLDFIFSIFIIAYVETSILRNVHLFQHLHSARAGTTIIMSSHGTTKRQSGATIL